MTLILVLCRLRQVLHAVRLIAPAVNAAAEPHPARSGSVTSADGWGWCADALAAAGLQQLADEAHMAAICAHMQEFKFQSAEQTLQVRTSFSKL